MRYATFGLLVVLLKSCRRLSATPRRHVVVSPRLLLRRAVLLAVDEAWDPVNLELIKIALPDGREFMQRTRKQKVF